MMQSILISFVLLPCALADAAEPPRCVAVIQGTTWDTNCQRYPWAVIRNVDGEQTIVATNHAEYGNYAVARCKKEQVLPPPQIVKVEPRLEPKPTLVLKPVVSAVDEEGPALFMPGLKSVKKP